MKKHNQEKKEEKNGWILNCIPSPNPENDWLPEHAYEVELLDMAAAIPQEKDLRVGNALWWEIGHQKSTGSCVGWATADSVIRYHFVKANKIKEKQLLSVR